MIEVRRAEGDCGYYVGPLDSVVTANDVALDHQPDCKATPGAASPCRGQQ